MNLEMEIMKNLKLLDDGDYIKDRNLIGLQSV